MKARSKILKTSQTICILIYALKPRFLKNVENMHRSAKFYCPGNYHSNFIELMTR